MLPWNQIPGGGFTQLSISISPVESGLSTSVSCDDATQKSSSFEFYDNERVTIARLHYHDSLYLPLPYNYCT